MCLSIFFTELKLKQDFRHCKRHGYQSMETFREKMPSTDLKNFRNLLLQSDKVELDIEAKFMDVFDPSNSNLVEEHEAIAVSFAHGQRVIPCNW